jgi:hypothetical protein
MGYWSAHPMGGDTPSEIEDELLHAISNNSDISGIFKNRDIDKLKEFIEGVLDEYSFVAPYVFKDLFLSMGDYEPFIQYMNDLLGDGGEGERDYEDEDEDSPNNYVIIFKNNSKELWSEILAINPDCKVCIEVDEHGSAFYNTRVLLDEVTYSSDVNFIKLLQSLDCPGLFEIIFQHVEESKSGLVNVN